MPFPSSARGCLEGRATEHLHSPQPAGGEAGGSARADGTAAKCSPAWRMLRLGGGEQQLRASPQGGEETLSCKVGKAPERQFAVSQLL